MWERMADTTSDPTDEGQSFGEEEEETHVKMSSVLF